MWRILICDDEEKVAHALTDALSDYAVEWSFTLQDSLDMLAADFRRASVEDRYAAVIIDLSFKGRGNEEVGFDILEAARGDPFLELIMYTGRGNEKAACKAIEKGACYIRKAASDLGAAVKRAVELHSAIVGLAKVIDDIAARTPRDEMLLTYARTAQRCILAIRGRE